ncbi:hypothetical protein F5Y17DRAFT_185727 [Xylariaceae sp. FL0594]|nr:hypothetical protein F5Y17DRAFT_185727 [Xylariaceae sp. FL0594]
MATVLGKRKLRTTTIKTVPKELVKHQKPSPSSPTAVSTFTPASPSSSKTTRKLSREEAEAKLAALFEAEFKPIFPKAAHPAPSSSLLKTTQDLEPESDDGSWGGLSDNETEASHESDGDVDFEDDEDDEEEGDEGETVEVIAHTDAYARIEHDKREARAWLSSRPPSDLLSSTNPTGITSKKQKNKSNTEEEDAPSLLKNDLALQRLLNESHLFSSALAKSSSTPSDPTSSTSALDSPTEHVGRNRHLATDLRLSALGSKTSIYKQEKMPMSFRKGIQAAAHGRETKRRQEARENGIILEKGGLKTLGKKAMKAKRKGPGRDIDAPAVGRLSNGMLKLSKRDIASIESSGPRRGGGGAKRRRR